MSTEPTAPVDCIDIVTQIVFPCDPSAPGSLLPEPCASGGRTVWTITPCTEENLPFDQWCIVHADDNYPPCADVPGSGVPAPPETTAVVSVSPALPETGPSPVTLGMAAVALNLVLLGVGLCKMATRRTVS